MNLPPLQPPKLNPRADFRTSELRKLVYAKGFPCLWEQAAECPCHRQSDAVVTGDFGYATPLGKPAATGECRPDCVLCMGRGYFYHSAQETIAIFTGFNVTSEAWKAWGEHARGMASITLLPENLPAFRDRFTLLDAAVVHRESRVRTAAAVEALRYPIVTRQLQLATGPLNLAVLYAHRANTDGVATAADVLTGGVDFEVTSDGKIDWTLGNASGKAPVTNARYSISYFAHPRYVVTEFPHAVRDALTITKQPIGTPKHDPLPVQAMARLEFLGGDPNGY